MLKFGDFLILAQMPEPQPAWAQQYNHKLQPIWARKFEPPAIAGRESEDAIATLLYLTEVTGDEKFLAPIPNAIQWLKRSILADGQIARFYELETNRPLYLTEGEYALTYDDSNLPTHYGFKSKCHVLKLEARYQSLLERKPLRPTRREHSESADRNLANSSMTKSNLKTLRQDAAQILSALDSQGRWVSSEMLIESDVFSKNLTRLAEFVDASKVAAKAP